MSCLASVGAVVTGFSLGGGATKTALTEVRFPWYGPVHDAEGCSVRERFSSDAFLVVVALGSRRL